VVIFRDSSIRPLKTKVITKKKNQKLEAVQNAQPKKWFWAVLIFVAAAVLFVLTFIILNTNGTFTWSLYGGGEGHWTSNGDTLTIMPNNCAPPINCNYYANECGNIIIVNGRSFTKKL
jgi:hypothetical protein